MEGSVLQARTDAVRVSGSLYDPRFEHDACGVGFVALPGTGGGREVLDLALTALSRLGHRGAVAADGRTSDGAGLLTQLPRRILEREAGRLGWSAESGERLALGMVFLPTDPGFAQANFASATESQGLRVLGWRSVPIDVDVLGEGGRDGLPDIRQVVVGAPRGTGDAELESLLLAVRKRFEREGTGAYVCSLSAQTVVYKGLCTGEHLSDFYPDLLDPDFETEAAVFHQRYSTNTLPVWHGAQPFRLLGHNGEINTLWANQAGMRAREAELPPDLCPVLTDGLPDSANLDEALELLIRNGRSLGHAICMMLVPAWEKAAHRLPPEIVAFHRYHAPVMEPWDGPAAIAFTDGRFVGAALDRNGLRPCRFKIRRDGLVVAGSEVGLFDLDEDDLVEKGRLGPGQMLLVDLEAGRILRDREIRETAASARPYGEWSGARALDLGAIPELDVPPANVDELMAQHRVFGLTAEDLKYVLGPMAENGKEPTWSMGDDVPVTPLARSMRPFYTFLRQRFAQVTNPALDSLRETSVMSLKSWIGPRPALLEEGPQGQLLELESPVLTPRRMARIRGQSDLAVASVDCLFDPATGSLSEALDEICRTAEARAREGADLLVLTDRSAGPLAAPVPMALVVGTVHHHLLRTGLRGRTDLIVEAGDCLDVHHVAVLVGYGAGAVCPWLAFRSARAEHGRDGEVKLKRSLEGSLRKVLAKMGIATLSSYKGGQIFEVIGLADEVVDRCFAGTPSPISGLGWRDLDRLALRRYEAAGGADGSSKLPDYGLVRYRRGAEAEWHLWQPSTVRALQGAVGSARRAPPGSPDESWDSLRRHADDEAPRHLRDLLEAVPAGSPVPLEEVEPVVSIVRRFVVSGMSLGALSPEAHDTLTIAMNRLGARSNTGEGGEDPTRYAPSPNGERRDSKVKQVASGRFGVTAEYLARAEEIEIKISQGSKPGEGGQLPGHKVTDLIARLRHAQPGRPLISPPPHHDIYSIEDLAQLIYDLKRCNPAAAVGVKLVAEAGVGTVAAGVAKGYADYVGISGHAGGTGASPLSSIKHAGTPWELGLAETQQTLVRNGLRSRVRVRVDGGLMTASDLLFAALLGADEFGFGTAPLVSMGCDMARQCHLNTCPTGIATQRPELRAKFRGSPEQVETYFRRLAQDLRESLAELGLRSVSEAVGRVDLLRQVRFSGGVDLSKLLVAETGDDPRCTRPNRRPDSELPLDEELLAEAMPFLERDEPFTAERRISNADRTVGARISGVLALRSSRRNGNSKVVDLHFEGAAGQSFGAFCGPGMRLTLTGEANDYVGKGLCGAELILRPTGAAAAEPHRNVILGNVALYGATGGRLFAGGMAGERFAVRNSGAWAVVEGVGDHGCEYMTGGTVVVLGSCGFNFGAGMTGGRAYVFDPADSFPSHVNPGTVDCLRPTERELESLRDLVVKHGEVTGSVRACDLLSRWDEVSQWFWKVEPEPLREEEPAAEEALEDVGAG